MKTALSIVVLLVLFASVAQAGTATCTCQGSAADGSVCGGSEGIAGVRDEARTVDTSL